MRSQASARAIARVPANTGSSNNIYESKNEIEFVILSNSNLNLNCLIVTKQKEAYNKGDWIRYERQVYRIHSIYYNPTSDELVYTLEKSDSLFLRAVFHSEAIKRFVKI